jgi:hypothetical protein
MPGADVPCVRVISAAPKDGPIIATGSGPTANACGRA